MGVFNPGAFIMQALVVAIDPSIWTPAGAIAWPGQERAVTVVDTSQPDYAGQCASLLQIQRPNSAGYSFRMGEECQKLFVFMDLGGGVNGGEPSIWFLARHESFHIAAQMYGSRIPVDFIQIDPELVRDFSDGTEFAGLYHELALLTTSIVNGSPRSCKSVELAYVSLSERSRTYLDYKIFWEWPAEFYAQQASFPGDFGKYESFRSQLYVGGDPGYELFVSGVRTGLALDALVGRSNWQSDVAQGQSMFHLLMAHGGCQSRKFDPTVRMRRVEL
ncbi:hypothetical protein [Pseudoxanthomonas koreensis]|uniref:hypothetical protein n=1 Tax=Pseudoxanthomonas koreensis TaxID=266061 RepID=UPI0013912E8C|nr:hypothetical protein [Pseudoxanthomonas koreensis]